MCKRCNIELLKCQALLKDTKYAYFMKETHGISPRALLEILKNQYKSFVEKTHVVK